MKSLGMNSHVKGYFTLGCKSRTLVSLRVFRIAIFLAVKVSYRVTREEIKSVVQSVLVV